MMKRIEVLTYTLGDVNNVVGTSTESLA
uniref:Uncharacterized protein n=1 Tax=Musa acuminata subsp. malaccensis TaxID=214687 RepID=A0A804HXP5_MUSAM